MRNLIRLLEDADIQILTIEAISDIDNPDQHVLSLLVRVVLLIVSFNVLTKDCAMLESTKKYFMRIGLGAIYLNNYQLFQILKCLRKWRL